MSSVVCIQTNDRVWIGADSAVSTQIHGQIYRLHEEGKKIFHIDDRVIFCSGIMELAANVMSEYESKPNRSLESLQEIAHRQCTDYEEKKPEIRSRNKLFLDILIAEYDKTRLHTVVYSISPYNDFEIVERILNSPTSVAVWTGGIRAREANDATMDKLERTSNIDLAFKYAFYRTSYEGIGGELSVYEIDKDGVRNGLRYKIPEKSVIKRLSADQFSELISELVIAERIVGQQITGVGLTIGSGNNITQINTNGISAGHATFSSAPFQVKMNGDVLMNQLTANAAQIKSSNFIDGTIVGSSINVGNGKFTVNSSGDVSAQGAVLSQGTITGAQIIGGSITSNTDINVTRDVRVGNNIYLGLTGQTNDRRIEFVDSGPYRSYIGFTNSSKQLEVYGANDVRITSGLDVTISAMQATLPSYSYLGSASSESNRIVIKSDLDSKAAYNMTYDKNTKNLKMWARDGSLLAQVTIS